MLFPLVVLAGLAIVGGVIQLPFGDDVAPPRALARAGGRVRRGGHRGHVGRRQQVPAAGHRHRRSPWPASSLAWLVYQKRRIKAVEPTVLANAWYYDRAVTDFMGGPGREAAEGAAWFDANVVDGAVRGTAVVVRDTAGELRKSQSGFVRAYAGFIGLGVVVLLAWFVVVRGIL